MIRIVEQLALAAAEVETKKSGVCFVWGFLSPTKSKFLVFTWDDTNRLKMTRSLSYWPDLYHAGISSEWWKEKYCK